MSGKRHQSQADSELTEEPHDRILQQRQSNHTLSSLMLARTVEEKSCPFLLNFAATSVPLQLPPFLECRETLNSPMQTNEEVLT